MFLAVLIGAMIAALGAGGLLYSMQMSLRAARNDRLTLQADILADSAIEEMVAHLQLTDNIPDPIGPSKTTTWNVYANGDPPIALTNVELSIDLTQVDPAAVYIFYRKVNANYYQADESIYGVNIYPYDVSKYDIRGFGLVTKGTQTVVVQKYKRFLKSNSDGKISFFVESSELKRFLKIKHI